MDEWSHMFDGGNFDSYIPVIVHHNKNELIVEVGEQDKKIYRIGRNELNKTS